MITTDNGYFGPHLNNSCHISTPGGPQTCFQKSANNQAVKLADLKNNVVNSQALVSDHNDVKVTLGFEVTNTAVAGYGTLTIKSGGAALNTTLDKFSELYIEAGATVKNVTAHAESKINGIAACGYSTPGVEIPDVCYYDQISIKV